MKLAVLIPAYNEENAISEVIKSILEFSNNVIVVVDGSTDGTLKLVQNITNVHVISTRKNNGLASAMKLGFRFALSKGYDAIVKMDADGQMDPSIYCRLIEEYKQNKHDLISATYNESTPLGIKKDIWLYTLLFNSGAKTHLSDVISEYRLYSRKAMSCFVSLKHSGYASNLAIIPLIRQGCICSEIKGGVDYTIAKQRPAPLSMLISLRFRMVTMLWQYGTKRSRSIAICAIPILMGHLLFNLTIHWKYNCIHWHRKDSYAKNINS